MRADSEFYSAIKGDGLPHYAAVRSLNIQDRAFAKSRCDTVVVNDCQLLERKIADPNGWFSVPLLDCLLENVILPVRDLVPRSDFIHAGDVIAPPVGPPLVFRNPVASYFQLTLCRLHCSIDKIGRWDVFPTFWHTIKHTKRGTCLSRPDTSSDEQRPRTLAVEHEMEFVCHSWRNFIDVTSHGN